VSPIRRAHVDDGPGARVLHNKLASRSQKLSPFRKIEVTVQFGVAASDVFRMKVRNAKRLKQLDVPVGNEGLPVGLVG